MKDRFFFLNFLLLLTLMLVSTSCAKAPVHVRGSGAGKVLRQVNAPWTYKFDSVSLSLHFDTYITSSSEKAFVKDSSYPSSGWQPWSKASISDINYEALAVILGFRANRPESFQDVENMNLAAPVRHSTTMLLLGVALVGLSRLGRKMLRENRSRTVYNS
jgi:hypothetical protein